MLIKIWKIKVNNWGWDYPRTFYVASREEAEKIYNNYPGADPIEYAGRFTEENASKLL